VSLYCSNRTLCSFSHGHTSLIDIETRGRRCGQTKIVEGRRSYCVPGKFAKGARFSPILGAQLLYDLKKHLKIKEIGSVQRWKDQQLVIEDIMKVEVPGYKLRLDNTQKIEAI